MSVVVDLGRERQERPKSIDALTALTRDDIRKVNQTIIDRMESPVILIPQVAGHIIAAGENACTDADTRQRTDVWLRGQPPYWTRRLRRIHSCRHATG